ncbi:hypothetical protein P7C70_g8235, partial [Phenoliferia sp. Uapishka_3]
MTRICLVNKELFLDAARAALFGTISLSNNSNLIREVEGDDWDERGDALVRDRFYELLEALTMSPHLCSFVRRIHFTFYWETDGFDTLILLKMCTRIGCISLEVDSSLAHRVPHFLNAISTSGVTLNTLAINCPIRNPQSGQALGNLLRSQPKLRNLSLHLLDPAHENLESLITSESPPSFALQNFDILTSEPLPRLFNHLTNASHPSLITIRLSTAHSSSNVGLNVPDTTQPMIDLTPFTGLQALRWDGFAFPGAIERCIATTKSLPIAVLDLVRLISRENDSQFTPRPFPTVFDSLPNTLVKIFLPQQPIFDLMNFLSSNSCPLLEDLRMADGRRLGQSQSERDGILQATETRKTKFAVAYRHRMVENGFGTDYRDWERFRESVWGLGDPPERTPQDCPWESDSGDEERSDASDSDSEESFVSGVDGGAELRQLTLGHFWERQGEEPLILR